MADNIQMPILPPNATPEQRRVWAQQMQAWNHSVQPEPNVFDKFGDWWDANIGSPGSSRPTFDPQTGQNTAKPSMAAAPTPPAVRPQPSPDQIVAQAAQPKGHDIELPQPDTYNFDPSTLGNFMFPADTDVDVIDSLRNLPSKGTGAMTNGMYQVPGLSPSVKSQYLSGADPVNGGGLSDLLSGLDTQDWLGIAGLGLGATGMYMNARTQKDQFDQQMAFDRQKLALQNSQFDQTLAQRQAGDGLNATQFDPYKQQNSLASSALRRALLTDGPAQAGVGSATPIDPGKANRASIANQFLNDDALGNAAGNFEAARLHADPGATPLNLSATGLGQAGANAQPAAAPQMPGADPALMNALMHDPHMQHAPEKKGGGFWKTLGKIGAIAAPIAAAPFTGGTSLALIGAGAGAANAALSGAGLKGTLLGAGFGAIPMGGGMANGAARPALAQGLKQAAKSTVRNPRAALALANALHG